MKQPQRGGRIQFYPVEGDVLESKSELSLASTLPTGPYHLSTHLLTQVELVRTEGSVVSAQIIRVQEAYAEVTTN